MGRLEKEWKKIYHRLRKLDRMDAEEEAKLLREAYDNLLTAYQKARGLNDEMELFVMDALRS